MESEPVLPPERFDDDCLIDVVKNAMTSTKSVDEDPELHAALNKHYDMQTDRTIEMSCRKCPVSCTIPLGETAIALIRNSQLCAKGPWVDPMAGINLN